MPKRSDPFPKSPEYVAVVGPRRSGKTTIAGFLAENLAYIHKPLPVLVVRETGKFDEVICTHAGLSEGDLYKWGRVLRLPGGLAELYAAVVFDGSMPASCGQCRVVSTSELP